MPPPRTYVPPIKRTESKVPEQIDFSDKSFPSLGVSTPGVQKKPLVSLSDLIKNKIQKDSLLEEERMKNVDVDVRNMTREQFIADGGIILSINRSK